VIFNEEMVGGRETLTRSGYCDKGATDQSPNELQAHWAYLKTWV